MEIAWHLTFGETVIPLYNEQVKRVLGSRNVVPDHRLLISGYFLVRICGPPFPPQNEFLSGVWGHIE